MSITGSLYSAVSGLKAQSNAIGTISDNISNASTVGYKASNAQFETLVTNALTRTNYTPGGVLPRPLQGVDRQGLLQASSSTTDIGIAGRGFFIVSNQLSTTGTLSSSATRAFTRAGSFQIDRQGNLVNTAGYYVLGVPTNTRGEPNISNPALSAVQPVNVGTLTGIASPSRNLSIGANLPAVPGAPSSLHVSGVLNGLSSVDDSNRYVITNSRGNAYEIKLRYTNTSGSGINAYNLQVISVLPVGTSPALDPTKTPIPASLGTITLTSQGASISGGTGLAFADGSTFQPTVNVAGLRYDPAAVNQVARAGVDQKDITSIVYDSLGVAHNLTLGLARASDLNRPAPSGVTNNVTLRGSLNFAQATVANGARNVIRDPNTYVVANTNGDSYFASIAYEPLPAGAPALDASNQGRYNLILTALTPIGDAVAANPAIGANGVALGTLAVSPTGSTYVQRENATIIAATGALDATSGTATTAVAFPASGSKPAASFQITTSSLPTANLTGLTLSRQGTNNITMGTAGETLEDNLAVGSTIGDNTVDASVTVNRALNATLMASNGFQYNASFRLVKRQDATNGPDVYDVQIMSLTVNNANPQAPTPSPAPSTTNPVTVGILQVTTTSAQYTTTNGTIQFTGGAASGSLSVPASSFTSQLTLAAATSAAITTTGGAVATNVASTGPSPSLFTQSGTVAAPIQNQWLTTVTNMTIVATGATSVVFPTSTGAQGFPLYLDGQPAVAGTTLSANTIAASLIKFNTDGTIQTGAPSQIPALRMTTGAADFGGQGFVLNLGRANTAGGLTQFTSEFAVSFLSQDGIPFGYRTGVNIDEKGLVQAVFDNGTRVPLFKIPLVNFASVNFLTPVSGNVYQTSSTSGDPVPNFAGVGGTGNISPATLEASTVDLSEEFSRLIVAQRTYAANARTITTSDELLQEVINIKR
jgi:flagellar hook protein FlgE